MKMAMETDELKDGLFHLAAYLVTSARGLYDEPADYGIFRLIDSAGRLLSVMENAWGLDPFLTKLKLDLDEEREGEMDEVRQKVHLDSMVVAIATELQKRLSN
jgi:hypothetical protein